ncbi:MAG TPA: molecular chaperone DnaK, partial [Methylomirabilota bacterium]
RQAVEQALNDTREALKGDDVECIRRAQENLTRVSRMLADAMSRETSGTAGGGNGGSRPQGGPQAGDVVDAEFKDADDRKP